MEIFSEKISKFLNSEGLEKTIEKALITVLQTLQDIKTFISGWKVETFKSEIQGFVSKIENTNLVNPDDVSNFRDVMEDYYLICEVTPGIILLLRGMFLFCASEIEKIPDFNVTEHQKTFLKIWEEIYKIAILNISGNPVEWIAKDPKKCIPWKPEFSKYEISEERFLSFISFVEKTLE